RRPVTWPMPPRPSAQAAVLPLAPREVSSGMRLIITAYIANADRVSAVASRRNGLLRTVADTPDRHRSCGRLGLPGAAWGGGGQGRRGASRGSGTVTTASTAASTT